MWVSCDSCVDCNGILTRTVVFLTDDDWKKLRASIASGRSLTLPTEAGSKLYLDVLHETYYNPVDGLTYKCSAGWKQYRPSGSQAGPVEDSHPHIKLGPIVLLTNLSRQECDPDALATYIKSVEKVIISGLPQENPIAEGRGKGAIIQLDILNHVLSDVQVLVHPNSEGLDIDQVVTLVQEVTIPSGVKCMRFQLSLNIWGGPSSSDGG
jgi:hypothetical protein